jgi:hypothetical protein
MTGRRRSEKMRRMGDSYKNGLVTPTWILSHAADCQLDIRLTELLSLPLQLCPLNPTTFPNQTPPLRLNQSSRKHARGTPTTSKERPRLQPQNTKHEPASPLLQKSWHRHASPITTDTHHVRMCYWYKHEYSCKHVTYALGRYCRAANLIQTPCKKRNIWQAIRMGEDCEECAVPEGRGGNAGGAYNSVPDQQYMGGVKTKRGKKR